MGAVFNRVTLTATGQTQVASAGANVGEAGWELNVAGTSWTGSVVLKQNTAPPGSAVSLSSVAYFNATTGALVAAGTAITSGGSFIVANTGLDLWLDYTHTAGSVQITAMAGSGQFGGVTIPAADIAAGTFGAYTSETGTYTFPGALTITGALTGVTALTMSGALGGLTQATFSTKLISTTALATPSALVATTFNAFASTVSGATLMGFGTTGDVTLKNRAGTDVIVVTANTVNVTMAGALAITGALSGVTTLTATSDVMAGAAAYVGFTGRSALSSPSDGHLKLSNAAGTAFSNLYYGAQGGATTSHRLQKAISAIVDNTDTAVFTVTVPNAAHSAMIRCVLVGSLGAGGAIGANEATQSIAYDIAIARTAGVATVATASSAYGSANSAVAGAATITVVGSVSAMTGAVGDPQTFSIYVKITKGSGASANHTCLALAEVLNANATGITIA